MREPQASRQRVVAITGASSGIGRATAQKFASEGWRVGLIARSADTLDAVRGEVVTLGSTASVATADVADNAALEAAAEHVERALGPIDVWVNNAGTGVYGRFLDVTEEEFRRFRQRSRQRTRYEQLSFGLRRSAGGEVSNQRGGTTERFVGQHWWHES